MHVNVCTGKLTSLAIPVRALYTLFAHAAHQALSIAHYDVLTIHMHTCFTSESIIDKSTRPSVLLLGVTDPARENRKRAFALRQTRRIIDLANAGIATAFAKTQAGR
jgi:hypothetical protein